MSVSQPVKSNLGAKQLDSFPGIPIDDPEQERRALERRGWAGHYRYLVKTTGCPGFEFGPGEYAERISEVYRRCFEPENDDPSKAGLGRGNLKVLSDFAAHCPHLIFHAEWIRTLMDFKAWDTDILRTLANGFRAAARLPLNQVRISRLDAARIAFSSNSRGSIAQDLREAIEGIDLDVLKRAKRLKAAGKELPRNLDESARIVREGIKTAAQHLAARYPLIESSRADLISYLERGQLYQARLLIVSRLFHVSARALQRGAYGQPRPPFRRTRPASTDRQKLVVILTVAHLRRAR